MVAQGLNEGVYVWRVEVPIQIRYVAHADATENAGTLSSEGVVTLYIQRVPLTVSGDGLAVKSYQYAQKTQ